MDFDFILLQLKHIWSVFVVLFVLIDVLGSVPIYLKLEQDGKKIEAFKYVVIAFLLMTTFLFLGDKFLDLLSLDKAHMGVAGAVVFFVMAIEMLLGIDVFRYESPSPKSALVPIVFPLLAGPGTFTGLIAYRSVFEVEVILIALFLNMVFAYFVLRNLHTAVRLIGNEGVYVLRKFFGVVLLAISVQMFLDNILKLFAE